MKLADQHPDLLKEVEIDPQERWMTPVVNRVALGARPQGARDCVIIRDDTLRSGVNTPGVYVKPEVKLRVAQKLESMGVVEAEVGYPTIPEHLEFVKLLKREGSKLQLGVHTRYYDPDYRREIARTIEAGADLVNLVGYWGYIMTQALCPANWNGNIEERIGDAVSYAKSQGAKKIAVGTDYHRLDLVARFVPAAVAAGADRIVVYDVRGWFVPESLAFLVRYVRALAGPKVEISVHCHDDMGLATINSIAAIRAGACACDVTVNSTGHRCGNAAFEQVVPALESLYGIRTGIDLSQLTSLTNMIAEEYKVPIASNRPITGRQMYSYGGSHLGGILRGQWYFWENIRAETVGNTRDISFGPTSLRRGRTAAVSVKIETMGLDADNAAKVEKVFEKLEPLIHKQIEVSEPDVEAIIRAVYA
jgi:isopropylmalate/homocitrate/citramalate synthase